MQQLAKMSIDDKFVGLTAGGVRTILENGKAAHDLAFLALQTTHVFKIITTFFLWIAPLKELHTIPQTITLTIPLTIPYL